MTLNEQQARIVDNYPLNDLLNRFPTKLRDLTASDESWDSNIGSLLLALLDSEAAYIFPTSNEDGNVAHKLFSIRQKARIGELQFSYFRPLVDAVVAKSPDIDIWSAVFDLITSVNPSTFAHSSIAPTFKGTPVKSCSSRLADSETREIVEKELFYEIKDCTFRDVGGFCDKFFNPKSWRKEQRAMLEVMIAKHDGKRWTGFPPIPNEQAVWSWLRSLEEHALTDAPHKLHTTQTAHQFKEQKGQMDIFFQVPAMESSGRFEHKDILVVGELKKSSDSGRFKADLLQLTHYIRGIFFDQPTRRFIHAFTLCASTIELWVYDRSGAYSSGPFDIHDNPGTFARALVGYATMDKELMGLDLFIEQEINAEGKEHRHVTLDDANDNATRIRLVEAMVRQKAIACRGTTCYRTGSNHVAKFSWASDKRKLEFEQLKLAEEKGVKGVARVVAHRQITTIAELRDGLHFRQKHIFRNEEVSFEDLPSIANTTGQKRGSSSDHISDASESKRRRSNSRKSKLVQKLNNGLSISKAKPSLYSYGEDIWDNRIYTCLVISPAGRVISDFKSIRELLEAMRDAIKAHQSLYKTGNILHRDISSNNIIITEPEAADGLRGMLIDLDLAEVKDSSPSGARHQTGTMQFMAVEVLRTVDHTYRHDLESFFYVLIWMCARQAWNNGFAGGGRPPKESLLRQWVIGSFREIASTKRGHMTLDGMDDITDEFPAPLDGLKPLCLKIRTILFGDRARLVLGTPEGDPDELYVPIIAAYDDAISNL